MSDETVVNEREPWQIAATEAGCYCAAYRKPCPYHEGYQDGWDDARERADQALIRAAATRLNLSLLHHSVTTENGEFCETCDEGWPCRTSEAILL